MRLTHPSQFSGFKLAEKLDVSIGQGLTSAEARRRLERDGSNELKAEPSAPGWRHFVAQFQDPLVYLLLLAVVVTLVVWGMEGATGWPVDGLVILTIVCLNASLGFWQETRSRKAAAALARLTEVTSAVRRDGKALRIYADLALMHHALKDVVDRKLRPLSVVN